MTQKQMNEEKITGVGILSQQHGLIALPKPCRHSQRMVEFLEGL